ncbi:hypothetical protein LAZ67_8003894, partial [Cordylochernes scorpioides]
MENIKPPAEFVPYNGEKKWETWREAFEIFSIAADLESMPLVRQRAILKHILGEKTVSIYKTFRVTENEAYPSIKEMLDMLSKHFKPFKNIIQIRNNFFTSVQKKGQGITEFVTELKQLAQECEFEELAESLIRDRFIIGMIDQEVKKKLLEDPQLTLPKAISVATIAESVCVQIASWEEKQAMIEKINKNTWEKNRSRVEKAKAGPSIANTRNECKWCGQQHTYGNCPAYRKTCNACGKLNHFAAVCRTRRIRNLISENEGDESFEGGINVNKVLVKTVRSDKWSAVISINGNKTSVHLDTGAQINVLPQKVISLWPAKPIIKPTSLKAYAYGHSELPIVGKCEVLCQYGEKKSLCEFIIADVDAQTLITGDTCEKLEILKRINQINSHEMFLHDQTKKILEQFHEVFQGVGVINSECKMYTKPEYPPVRALPRRIPASLGNEVQSELEKMVKQGIITKIYHETEWSHPMVVVKKKSGQIRICLDPRKLNQALNSFRNVTYVDDLLIYADSIEEPNEKLKGILEIARRNNIKFDLTKAQICKKEVSFLGHMISKNGIDPEPNKVDKVINLKKPEDKKSLQRVMGLYNYLGKFIPNLAASTSNIRGILKKNVVWHWGPRQDIEFHHIKECVRNAPSLGHYDKTKTLVLQCDASKDAMGAALLQENRPLAFASASFNDSQKQYSQIEKELLSIYYGCKKFEYLLLGHTFIIQTDHQPLLPLIQKPLTDISPRLQRIVMKLFAFDFKLQYRPGKCLILADTLSRDTHPIDELPTPFLEDRRMVKLISANISDEKLITLQKDTREDTTLLKIIHYVIEGWPISKKDVDEDVKPYYDFRHRIYLWNELLCVGSAIVVPGTQRNYMLELLHKSHQGISAIQGLARESLFWPGMSMDIAERVKSCDICQKYQKSKTRETLRSFPIPDYPWQTVSMDIFYIERKPHLLIVDRFSGYPEVYALNPPTATNVRNKLRETFARFGIPETIMSDNGPPFHSEIMTDFCTKWGIRQIFSSPHLHRSNGLAERNIQTIKTLLNKCKDQGSNAYLALLTYRNTPKNDLPSPAQLCLSRSLRCLIPRITPLYGPCKTNQRHIENAKKRRQNSMKRYYDRSSKIYPKVSVGEEAWCQLSPKQAWTPVKITAHGNSPQSFKVETPSGREFLRNQQFLGPKNGPSGKGESPSLGTSFSGESSPVAADSSSWQRTTEEEPVAGPSTTPIQQQPSDGMAVPSESSSMVETRSGKMQDTSEERLKTEESAKPQPSATIGRDASADPVVLNPNIDIPKYDGTEDPRPWIESLEEIGFLYHWAEYIISRYAAMNMIGSAKTWLDLHKISFTSWEHFKSRLIQDFGSDANKEELKMRLNRMQQWNEPAIRFAEDILVLCNKVDPQMEEENKINWVIGGLKKEYSFALYLNPPKNTNELLRLCKKMDLFENNYQERIEKSKVLYNGPRSPRSHHQEQCKNAPSFRRPDQNTSKPQAPAPRYYQNTPKPQAPAPRYYQNKPLPQVSAPRRFYTPIPEPKPVYPRKTYNKSPDSNRNRTEDGRPICFKCNKPGHVARYCRVKFIFRVGRFKLSVAPDSFNQSKSTINGIRKLDPRYKININVDKIGLCEALIDTGADLSVVDLRTALFAGREINSLTKTCSGPDGKKLDMVGSIILDLKIDDTELSHEFVVMDAHLRTLILGRDFLKKMNAKIDCKRETIKYNLMSNHDVSNYDLKKIKSTTDTVIPKLSIKLIRASIEAEDGEYVIEENNRMTQTNGLRLARSLLTVTDKKTHIWITNPYPRPLKIMKDQTLAYGSLPAGVNFIENKEKQNENDEIQFQINKNLSFKEQERLKQILAKYTDLFSSRLGRTSLAKHQIHTEDAKPIKHKPYRVSAKERTIIKDQIDEMLEEGIIRQSSSPWSFPVILVKKRDGKYRFCVDYRKLNEVTVKDVYPIPRIDDVMDTLQGSKYFSAIDLKSGYWQVEIEERDKEKTAFTTAHGLYEFNVMPFGLCNAPATFERNMDNVLGNLRWQICLCYLDDVIIYSSDFPTHIKRLEAVLRCFSESNLKLNAKKCRFAFEELEILGHITNQEGIKPAEYNIKAVRDFPQPKKAKEVQSFLGMCSYYRKFIKDFSLIADPLTSLIRKNVQFIWTGKQEEAFQNLKKALMNPPILGHFDPNAATCIHTDASNIGLGATLIQNIGGEEKVISYLSRTLSKPEQNYSTTEKECLAVVWSISKLRPYLYGRHFKIVTDHHALCWLKNLKDPTGRLARWALKIQEYNFEIIHKSGKKHLDADGLSRGPLPENEWDEDYERLFLNQIIDEKDDFIENIKENLSGNKRSITQNFKEENGCLYKKNPNPEGREWLLVVPKKRRKEIMSEYHNHMLNGHLGVARTTYRLKNKYYWPSMLKDVSEFVKTCHLCQSRKGSNQLPSGLLQPIPPANYPFERIGIDFVGPLPSTKRRRKWIIVLTDYYTKYAETKAVPEATVKEVSTFLIEHIFLRHGAPRFLISDRGSQFTSNLMKEVMKMCKVKHCFTTSYHPQTNGLTERLNRTLINMISMYVNTDQKNWDEILPFITHAYNTTIQETTGYSPFFLLFGREPMSLLDDENIPTDSNMDDYDEYIENYLDKIARTRQVVINNTEKTQERMKRNYDKKHNERIYEPGHLVAVWTPVRKIGKCEKLLRKYFGPYRILKKLSNVNYLIEPKDNPGQDPLIVHVSRLKPYFERIDEVTHEDMVETRSGKMQDTSEEKLKTEESAKPQPSATIGRDASADPVVLNPNKDIPKYDGTEDPRPWIESLEEIGFLYHWAEYIISRYAAMNMIGSAKTWLDLHKISFTSWEHFKSRLIQDFASDANKEEMKMRLNRMQQWNEPAIRFAEDILVLCNKVDPQMEEENKINWVIGGLKKEYSFALYLNPPKNTNELLRLCKKMDLFENNYQERIGKAKALYNGPRSPRSHHQEQWKNAPSFRRPDQNTSKPQAPAPRYYLNTSKPQAPTPRYYQNKPLPQVSAPRRSYTPNPEPKPVYPRKTYNKSPDSNRNRTEDGRPICFKCNKPGHVARYCRAKFVRIVEEDPLGFPRQETRKSSNGRKKILYTASPLCGWLCEALIDTGADLSVVDLRTALLAGREINSLTKTCSGPDGKKLDMGLNRSRGWGICHRREQQRMTQTNGLRLTRSLLTVTDKKPHIWITNPYPRPLKIMKDQTLAYGSLPAEENRKKRSKTLKKALINPPILGHFDPNAATCIHTDAFNIGLGATLIQNIGGEEKVISYLSRTLSKSEQYYSTTEKECLAVVWSISKLRPYLYGRHFKIVTDHHALCWLKNLKDPTGRLARWALKIQEYNFEIIHKSGKKHLGADGLSKGPLPDNEWDEDYERLFLNQIIDEKDDFIENIKENLSGNKRSITQNFKEENGCLYKKNPNPEGGEGLLVVPKKRRKDIMSEYHNHMLNGHLGVARTTYRLKNKYFWPSMLKDVSEFVKTCHLCQSRKGSNQLPSGLLQPIPPANYPFERIGIDFVGPLPSTKRRRKWIIVLTDYYTKYSETKAVPEATVKEVSTFLIEHIFLRHGAPRFLISDRGSQFTSNLMKEVMKMCKIKHCFTTSYHPQTNGLTERLNRTLINMISMYVNTDQKNWDEILPFITHAYNTTIQETTGNSPFFLLFGREPMSLLDDENIPTESNMDDYDEYTENYLDKIASTRQVVINNTEKTQKRMKRNYDKKHNERIYEPGHLVAVWTPVRKIGKCEKLLRKYFGPYRILKKLSNVNYLIEPKDNPGQDPLIVHVSRLKPYFERIDEVTHED